MDFTNNTSCDTNSTVKNKGFLLLDKIFVDNGWSLIKNEFNHICYAKIGYETNIFDIRIFNNCIRVSIPVKNSPYQYVTAFNGYFHASEYIEARFYDFIGKD